MDNDWITYQIPCIKNLEEKACCPLPMSVLDYFYMPESFDPIEFLELSALSDAQKEHLRPELYKDMAQFLLEQFIATLSDEQLQEVEHLLPNIKNYDDVIELIRKYNRNFESLKIMYLKKYKKEFRLQKFTAILGT